MNALVIFTGFDLKRELLSFLQAKPVELGAWNYAIARGQDKRPAHPTRSHKSSGSETTFR